MEDLLTKEQLLSFFREQSNRIIATIKRRTSDAKKQSAEYNKQIISIRERLIEESIFHSQEHAWDNIRLLEHVLLVTYCCNVVMLESRNSIWTYEYMTFSRRIGELWEPFCKLCFEFPINAIGTYPIPEFSEVEVALRSRIDGLVDSLDISDDDKTQLYKNYELMWDMVKAGDIQLKSDLHFSQNDTKYVVDFKSGFGSNEKGNVNRLKLVGSIYKNILNTDNYSCLIFVRSTENNHYLTTLRNSGTWEVFCGSDTYNKIHEYTGYDLASWISTHISWMDDFNEQMRDTIIQGNLQQYLIW